MVLALLAMARRRQPSSDCVRPLVVSRHLEVGTVGHIDRLHACFTGDAVCGHNEPFGYGPSFRELK